MTVGLETSVISREGSVISTCLRSNFGEKRVRSGPMGGGFVGDFPGPKLQDEGLGGEGLGGGHGENEPSEQREEFHGDIGLAPV